MKRLSNLVPTLFVWMLAVMIVTAVQVYAQAVVPVAAPTFLDGITKWIADNSGTMMVTITMVIEFILRLVPTQSALSVLVPFRYVVMGLVVILTWVAGILGKLSVFANNVK